jgi:hypothetical protein
MLILGEIQDEFHYVLFSRGFVGGVIYDLLEELVFAGFVKHQPAESDVGISQSDHQLFGMLQSILFNKLTLDNELIKTSETLIKNVIMAAGKLLNLIRYDVIA